MLLRKADPEAARLMGAGYIAFVFAIAAVMKALGMPTHGGRDG